MEGLKKVGVDLGTSHVSIAYEDTVITIPNVAGKASDIIAQKFFGEDWIVGEKAIEEERALEICYPVKGGLLDHQELERNIIAERAVINYLFQEIQSKSEHSEEEIGVVVGVSPLAIRNQKELILKIFEDLSKKVLIAPSTFLVGYAEGIISHSLIVDIGAGTIDITPLYGATPSPEDHVVLRVGGDFIDQKLYELFKNEYPDLPCSIPLVRSWKEKYATVKEKSIEVEVPTPEGFRTVEIGHILTRACKELIPMVVKGIKEVLPQLPVERWSKYLNNIYLAGRGSKIEGFPEALQEALSFLGEVKVQRVSNPDLAVVSGAKKLAEDLLGDLQPSV